MARAAATRGLRPFFVDHHILAVVKPAGLLSVPDSSGEPSLVELMGSWLRGASAGNLPCLWS
jgi:23S rRNA-/tRNA-specific pseudouridylate synthase